MWLMKNQTHFTKGAVIVTFIFALVASAGFLTGRFEMWATLLAIGIHLLWVGIAYRKRLSISKNGIEIENDDEGKGK